MRGKALENGGGSLDVRITPACAGKSHFATNFHLNKRDHPRMCGEKWDKLPREIKQKGSPPHVRGKDFDGDIGSIHIRITPACAGKRRCKAAFCAWFWDHPRMCGEKLAFSAVRVREMGSPPHVRGKVLPLTSSGHVLGITPACAGKSMVTFLLNLASEDHPRVCGEKKVMRGAKDKRMGSPPRMRGKD